MAFLPATGDADDAAAFELGDLPGDATDGTGGAGEDDGFAGFRLADVEQGEVGGHAGHAQGREVAGQGGQAWVDLVQALGFAGEVVLYAERAVDVVAGLEVRVL